MDHITPMGDGADGEPTPTGPIPSFLTGLTQAMRAAASRERDRIVALVAATAQEHVEKAHARAAVEAAELRRLADEDIHGIDLWASREVKRIRREAAQRSKERRADLASYLERHETIIAREVAGVEAAVTGYTAELDRFVTELVESDDPARIARQADTLPMPPDFDAVRARSRLEAVAAFEEADTDVIAASMPTPSATVEPVEAGVPVMDPEAEGRPADVSTAEPEGLPPAEPPAEEAPPAGEAPSEQPNGAMRLIRALTPWVSGESSTTDEGGTPTG